MENYDVTVIGSGPGGYPAAIKAAQLGASVAIVEKEKPGGTCLNWGCIPTKALIASSDLFARMNNSGELGLSAGKTTFDFSAMIKRKDEVVAKLSGGVQQLLKANGVTVIEGTASFKNKNTLAISPSTNPPAPDQSGGRAGNQAPRTKNSASAIKADAVIIATGSTSAMPGFLPKSKLIVDSKMFLTMTELPPEMIVLGGGVIGCEFACMAAQLGTSVTIVEMLEDILIMLDADIRRELRRHMEKELGITILTGKPLTDIKAAQNSVSGKLGKQTLKAGLLLASVGRLPVTEGLALEKAGLETNENGFIAIDEYLKTSVAGIYAVGDVTAGTTQLAHAATSQGITAAENACGKKRNKAETIIPACIFTSPEIGSAGLTEQQAKDQGLSVKTGKYMLAGLGKALAAGEASGFVKLIADADTDQLLGAHAVGAHATELISEAAMAIRAELTAGELGSTIHCHPTFSEAWMEAAHAVHGECIHQPPKRRR